MLTWSQICGDWVYVGWCWGLYGDFSIGREGLRLYMKGFNVCRIGFR